MIVVNGVDILVAAVSFILVVTYLVALVITQRRDRTRQKEKGSFQDPENR